MSEYLPESPAHDHPPARGFLQTFPGFLWVGLGLFAIGPILLWMPWENPQAAGYPLLFLGIAILVLSVLCEFTLNQVYWTSKRRDDRKQLAELAGKKKGRKQVWITKLSERDSGDGGTFIEVRKEVRKRLPRK
jgi:hypothetical protein